MHDCGDKTTELEGDFEQIGAKEETGVMNNSIHAAQPKTRKHELLEYATEEIK